MSARQHIGEAMREPSARILPLPQDRVVAVEHPCIIRDIDRGITTLGGEHQIKQALEDETEDGHATTLAISLRADDPLARKLLSQRSDVNQLLLRISIPQRTGRKRKRGTDDPFLYHDSRDEEVTKHVAGEAVLDGGAVETETPLQPDEPAADSIMPLKADEVFAKLQENKHDLSLDVIGVIGTSHRFRNLPDFQLLDGDNHVMQQVVRQLRDPSLDKLAAFSGNLDFTSREPPTTLLGPPSFTHYSQQLYYGYAQARGTSTQTDSAGRSVVTNTRLPQRRIRTGLSWDAAELPSAPPASLPSLSTTDPIMQELVSRLEALLATRPIVTRRAAHELISPLPANTTDAHLGMSMQYVGYMFRSGPWKDTLVRFGIDPRLDPQYRKYQTLTFQLSRDKFNPTPSKRWSRATDGAFPGAATETQGQGHIFDGKRLGGVKTLQLCDITDPMLRAILDSAEVKTPPDIQGSGGFFPPATIALVRAIMRDKIAELMGGEDGDKWSHVYERIIAAVDVHSEPGAWSADWFDLSKQAKKKGMDILSNVKSMFSIATSASKVGDDDALGDLEALNRDGPGDESEDDSDE